MLVVFTTEDTHALTDVLAKLSEIEDDNVARIKNELGVTEECAAAVSYLRTRRRHTLALERELVAAFQAGHHVDINTFGC
jgi:hypothetical protein